MHGAPSGAASGPRGGPVTPPANGAAAKTADKRPPGEQSRCTFAAESLYPSAKTCRVCHEKIYEEWSISSHAYAAVSPMFHKFEQKINDLTQGTIGYFCYRCHSPAGTTLGISRAAPMYDLPPVELAKVPTVCGSLREAVRSLEADHEFLLKGNVFTREMIEGYLALKMEETLAFETMPHPIEYMMYYSS